MNRSPLLARLTSRPVLISPAGMEGLLATGRGGGEGRGVVARILGAVGAKGGAGRRPVAKAEARIPDALDGRAVEARPGYLLADGVAVIRVEGVLWDEGCSYDDGWWSFSLYGYDDLRRAIAAAEADDAVKAVWLRINSPGGLVTGMMETCAVIAGCAKPVTAFVAGDGCSAAYALASSASRIVCAPAAAVGSIGVVWVHVDTSKMNEEWGLTYTPIQFGAAKTDGAPFKPLSDSALAHFQAQIDTLGRRFVDHVAEQRGLSVDEVLATEARVEIDDDALALGLVDEVAPEAAAFAAFVESLSAGAPASPPASPASAQHAATQEETMGLKQQIEAALARQKTGKASAEDTLKRIAALTAKAEDGADEPAASEGEDDEEMTDDEEEPVAEGDPVEEEASDDGEDKPAAKAKAKAKATAPKPGTSAHVLAILDLPEAKGREALARKLAVGGMSVAAAKDALAAAPKGSAFQPQNPTVASGGGSSPSDPNARLLAAAETVAKQAGR
jgi:signal peptide peptidase SppA